MHRFWDKCLIGIVSSFVSPLVDENRSGDGLGPNVAAQFMGLLCVPAVRSLEGWLLIFILNGFLKISPPPSLHSFVWLLSL